jgi:peptidoglycan hydrolase CwlO-like protein
MEKVLGLSFIRINILFIILFISITCCAQETIIDKSIKIYQDVVESVDTLKSDCQDLQVQVEEIKDSLQVHYQIVKQHIQEDKEILQNIVKTFKNIIKRDETP